MKANLTPLLMMIVVACATVLPIPYVQEAQAAPSVVGLWRFNEGSGTNVLDSSGLGNNGTLMGENGNVPTWVAGQSGFGSALRFTNNGADHAYVNIPAANSLMIGQTATNAWTMTCWAYEDSDGTGNFVASYGRLLTTDDGAAFQLESGAVGDAELYTWSGMNNSWQIAWGIGSSVAPLLDQWVHWAVVYDGTNITVYRNGNQGPNGGVASQPVTAPLGFPGYTGAILIASELDQAGTANWNGMLDDVAVFAGALTQTQIDTVMSGDFSSFIGGPVNFVSEPQSQSVFQGADVTFGVGVAGQSPFQYQWYLNGTKLASVSNPTATNATLVLSNVQLNQAGTYSLVVSNALGSATNTPTTLSVFRPQPLVGLWRFNQSSGTNVFDSSGLGNNGYLASINGSLPVWAAGQAGFGNALSFTNYGTNYSFAVIPSSSTLLIGQTATNPWTITAWAYESSDGTANFVANYGRIMVIDDGTAFQLESGAVGDAELYTWARANAAWQIGWGAGDSVSPLLDQWVHWAVVYDGTNITVYRDGNQGPNGGVASLPLSPPSPLGGYFGFQDGILIGTELAQTADRNWNGLLDDEAVFNVALTQAQVQSVMGGNFNAFITQPPPELSVSSGAGNVVISWPSVWGTYQLQSTASLAPSSWTSVTNPPVLNGSTITVTLPLSGNTKFFRLAGP